MVKWYLSREGGLMTTYWNTPNISAAIAIKPWFRFAYSFSFKNYQKIPVLF